MLFSDADKIFSIFYTRDLGNIEKEIPASREIVSN